MKILSQWLRAYLPALNVSDRQLAEDLTLRGIAVEGVFDLGAGNGSLFDMDITTNRVDAMNHYGIAREAAAIYNLPLTPLDVALPQAQPAQQSIPIRIDAPDLCGRFVARLLRGVTIAPATAEVAQRFALLEQKPISNAVDATNYTLLAMGHPTHAFDLDKIEGGIVVRRARDGERLRLLDGTERTLVADDLVVADERKALALAGVMGGWETMITPETKNILVEAAWFDPASVRRSSRRHGLHTDASHRFERGADFAAPPVAAAMVCRLILAAGGHLEGDLVDVIVPAQAARTTLRPAVTLALADVTRILGRTLAEHPLDAATVTRYLTALGCRAESAGDGATLQVHLPSWRLDVERDIDLIEEIARLHGYNRFANTLPAFAGSVVELPTAAHERTVRGRLLAAGYTEAIASTFCSAADAERFAATGLGSIPLENPLSEEAGHLRPSLLPGMLAMLAHNLNHSVESVRLFEMGTVFSGTTERVVERPALALGATGTLMASAQSAARTFDFYDMKGALEQMLSAFAGALSFHSAAENGGPLPTWLHPGRAARVAVDGVTVGHFGQLASAEAAQRKLKQTVFVGELDLQRLFHCALRQPAVRALSRFPAVERDFSFVFADAVRWEQIAVALAALKIAEMREPQPMEIFRDAKGKAVPQGHYSLLVRTTFQSLERTLREDEVQTWSDQVMDALTRLGGVIRDGVNTIAPQPARK